MPSLGVEELIGPIAITVTWILAVAYLLLFFLMIILILSYLTQLKSLAKKKVQAIDGSSKKPVGEKRKRDVDQQSTLTYSERLSEAVMRLFHLFFYQNTRISMVEQSVILIIKFIKLLIIFFSNLVDNITAACNICHS